MVCTIKALGMLMPDEMAKNLLVCLARLPIIYLTAVNSNNSEKKLIYSWALLRAVDAVVINSRY